MATSETTAQALTKTANARAHRLAFVILFEGVGLAFTTSEDVAGIAAAWLHSSWQATPGGGKGDPPETATWYPTAFLPGAIKQEVEFFNPKIPSDSLSFMVGDPDDTLASMVFGQNRQAARTFLTTDISPADSALVTQTTTGFSALGSSYYLYVGLETMLALDSDRTSTGWSFVSRGRWAFHTTDIGSEFTARHVGNRVNSNDVKVTSAPTCWFNRRCRIYVHHYEPGNGWSSYTQALLWWEGLLRNPTDNGDRTLTFNAVTVAESLKTNLFERQFTADLAEGVYLETFDLYMAIREKISGVATKPDFVVALNGATAGQYSASQLLSYIKAQLRPAVSGTTYTWDVDRGQDGRVQWMVTSTIGVSSSTSNPEVDGIFFVALSKRAWSLLGFAVDGIAATDYQVGAIFTQFVAFSFNYSGTYGSPNPLAHWILRATNTPILLSLPAPDSLPGTRYRRVSLQNIQGDWAPQFALYGDQNWAPQTQGYLKIGDMVILGGYYDSTAKAFWITQTVADQFTALGFSGSGLPAGGAIYHEGDSLTKVSVAQIWYERDAVKDVILRLVLSTGTLNFNSASWDKNPAGLGIGVPYDLIDVASFLTLGNQYYVLLLTQPTEASVILESLMATFGRQLMWRQGLLSLVEPRIDGPTIASAYTLTESNKADRNEHVRVELSTDAVINRIELRYQQDFGGAFQSTAAFEDLVSSSDFGKRNAIAVEAWGISNPDGVALFAEKVVARALAFFSRPMASVPRTIDKSLILMCPCDTALLTDNYPISPKTGRRGLTNWPTWVKSVEFDPSKMSGTAELAYSGDMDVDKICPWAPSARVNEGASNAGYVVVDGTHRYIAIKDNVYTAATDPDGPESFCFNAGDFIIIRELSPADPRAPLIIHAQISSGVGQGVDRTIGNGKLFLTATISTWDPTKLYVVTPDVITTVAAVQRGSGTFIADDATDTTGLLANDPYIYGVSRGFGVATAATMNQPFVKPPIDGSIDSQGKPLAVADLWEAIMSLNVAVAYKTRHLGWTQCWNSNPAGTQTASRELLAGPVWVPLYARGARGLRVRLMTKASSTGTIQFFVTSSRLQPYGQANAAPGLIQFVDPTTGGVSDSYVGSAGLFSWRDLGVLPCYPDADGRPPGVWITIEGFSGNAGISAILGGVSIYEDHG